MSDSTNFRGTCSHHGGVAVWNDDEMRAEANQWCDDNPSLCANSHWVGIEGHGDHPPLRTMTTTETISNYLLPPPRTPSVGFSRRPFVIFP
jgi:hypothetical protein